MTKASRAALIEQHVQKHGVTACPDGSAVRHATRGRHAPYYWGKKGQGGRRSARSPFFVRGEGCV